MTDQGDGTTNDPVNHDHYSDAFLREILDETRFIAMVGASANWKRPSNFVMKYLLGKGYEVHPVNPKAASDGVLIVGRSAYPSLAETPAPIDLVDIFRSSEAAGAIVDETIELAEEKQIRTIWMQLGVRNDEAAARAEAAGLKVVMNRCPKIEWARLNRELAWGGVNTGVISARRSP